MFYMTDYRGDIWSASGRYGDCEDYAIRKLLELRRHGIEGEIGVYWLADRKVFHAVAIVAGRILDNMTDLIRPAAGIRFKFKTVIRDGAAWTTEVNGRRIDIPPIHRRLAGLEQ